MIKVVLTIEGGVVQNVTSNSKDVEVHVLDFDSNAGYPGGVAHFDFSSETDVVENFKDIKADGRAKEILSNIEDGTAISDY